MKVTRENECIVEREGDGSMVYAIRVSDITQVKRDDRKTCENGVWRVFERRTDVLTQFGVGHSFRCDADHIWTIIHAKETT
jgi:hypothetical protein